VVDRPNILLILTDQLSATMMSCAGNPYLRTPAMDSLAASGVRFARAYCTNPVCVPSRFSMMTGRLPSEIGLLSDHDVPRPTETIWQNGLGWLLRKVGYETAYGGKVHLPGMTPEDVGFSSICPDERDELARTCARFLSQPRPSPFCLVASFINPHDICYLAIRDFMQTEGERGIIAGGELALRTLDQARQRPGGVSAADFFAHHCPPLPPNFEPQDDEPEVLRLLLEQRPFRMKARREWSAEAWREHRWAYARLTEVVDAQIRIVLDALEASGQADRTLVILTSDHGDMDAAHRMEHKSTPYEEACRIPLLVRAPGGARGGVNATNLVSSGLDLLPTICDYAQAAVPQGLQGRSLRGLLAGGAAPGWRAAVPVESAVGRAVVTATHKYIAYDLSTHPERVIDLVADPGEMQASLAEAAPGPVLAGLRQEFRSVFGERPRDPELVRRALSQG